MSLRRVSHMSAAADACTIWHACLYSVTCAAVGLEYMLDKLPLAKLGTTALYSCSKLAGNVWL